MMNSIQLDDWQQEIMDYEGNIILGKGRRIGATHVFGRKAIDYLMSHKNNHPSSQIVCVSITEDQAQLIILFALQYAEEKYKQYIGRGKDKPTLGRIVLKVNGNRRILIAKPVGATGDSLRGFEGQILMVDEASKMPKLFWAAAKPILLTTGGKIWMWSTFFGRQEYFWKSFDKAWNKKDPNSRFKVWLKNSEEVIENRKISNTWTQEQREGALEILRLEKEDMTTLEYNQEYMAIPSDKLRQLFDEDLIKKCQTLYRPEVINQEHNHYLGVDVARLGEDESTFEVIEKIDNDNLIHVEHMVTTKTLTTKTTIKIFQLEDKYQFKEIFIDAYNVGVGVFDDLLSDDRTKRKSVAIGHSSKPLDNEEKKKTKVTPWDLYANLKKLMEQEKIKLLKSDEVFSSLYSIQYEHIGDKIIITGSYKHIADGLVRAAWCSKDRRLEPCVF